MNRGARPARSRFANTLAALALLAVFVRALIPAGYMISPRAEADGMVITLCTGQGSIEAVVDRKTGAIISVGDHDNGGSKAPGKSTDHHPPCVFSASATLAGPAPSPVLDGPVTVALPADQRRPEAIIPGRGLAAPPPWSTGPPLTV